MEQHQAQGTNRQACCIAQSFVQSVQVLWIVTFKVSNHLPQENGLDQFNNFLVEKDEMKQGEFTKHTVTNK